MLSNLIEKNKQRFLIANGESPTQKIDISNYMISTHAIMRYATKCNIGLSIENTLKYMKEKLKSVRISDNKSKDGAIAYIDGDENIYITKDNSILTTYPNKRIFVAKTLLKKRGRKYL